MSAHNGTAQRIVAFVTAHPGCTRAEMLAGCGIEDIRDAMPTYCTRAGLIHSAGPRGSQRYFATAEMAQSRHSAICRAVQEQREAKRRACHRLDNLRRRAARHAAGGRVFASRFGLPPGVKLAPDVRITIAKPIPDRWAA